MIDLAEIQAAYYVIAAIGVIGTLLTAVVGVSSYINSNKRAEDAKKKEQETRNRELETRQAQLLMNIYSQFNSKDFISSWYVFLLKEGKSYKEFMSHWNNDREFRDSFGVIATFFEGMGTFVREGFLDIRSVALMMSPQIRGFWEKIGPWIPEDRVVTGNRRQMENTEYLYNTLLKFMEANPEVETKGQVLPPSELFQVKT